MRAGGALPCLLHPCGASYLFSVLV